MECPKCGQECDGENVSGHIGFLNFECECGLEFCHDENRGEYYDMDGNIITLKVEKPEKKEQYDISSRYVDGEDVWGEEYASEDGRLCRCHNRAIEASDQYWEQEVEKLKLELNFAKGGKGSELDMKKAIIEGKNILIKELQSKLDEKDNTLGIVLAEHQKILDKLDSLPDEIGKEIDNEFGREMRDGQVRNKNGHSNGEINVMRRHSNWICNIIHKRIK